MDELRKVVKVTKGRATSDGAGVKLVRVLGPSDTKDYDPFLMLDAFDADNPDDYVRGFPWHPHRGIETITYLIHGDIEHGDSLGNKGRILDGECQWMTAGSGIIHQEMPQASPRMLGAQLWLNLPAKDKMTDPSYGDIKAEDVPIIENDGVRVHIIAGEYQGCRGAFEGKYVKATYFDVELPAEQEWEFDDDPENTLFIYIFSGRVLFDPAQSISDSDAVYDAKQAVLFSHAGRFWIKAVADTRFILLSAKPLNEPIAWGGPIVMNTREELRQAFRDLDNNTFIKKR
ncbi:MAG TPA: pirin family protein [Firmicutes bacterium]|jgi:redox-sensitive bicupin YhaK (pirin superfamily)|nr:pirin family protein [Bacillota bacterium]